MRKARWGECEGGAVFVDGDFVPLSEAKVSLFACGFARSDATYDVVTVWKGAFFHLGDHVERFFASLTKLRLSIAYDRAQRREILHGCVRAGGPHGACGALRDGPASRDPVNHG